MWAESSLLAAIAESEVKKAKVRSMAAQPFVSLATEVDAARKSMVEPEQ